MSEQLPVSAIVDQEEQEKNRGTKDKKHVDDECEGGRVEKDRETEDPGMLPCVNTCHHNKQIHHTFTKQGSIKQPTTKKKDAHIPNT